MPLKFKYTYLESEADRAYARLKAHEIRSMLPKMEGSRVPGEDYFAIGSILLDIRSRMMPKRLFYAWVDSEVHMSKGVAACYMKVVRVFRDKYETLKHVPYTTLYELTYPSYPSFILERIEAGGYVPSLEKIQEIRAENQMTRSYAFREYAQLDVYKELPPGAKDNEQHDILLEVQSELKRLREENMHLSNTCFRIEQEKHMLISNLRKIAELDSSHAKGATHVSH